MNNLTINDQRKLLPALTAVANWWAEHMQKPMNWDNGDDSPHGGMAFMMGNMLSSEAQKTITPENIEDFKKNLIASVAKEMANGNSYMASNLSVDYDPCRLLCDACVKAGINSASLPIKSHTRINDNFTVTGSYKYGGKTQIIYEAPAELTK